VPQLFPLMRAYFQNRLRIMWEPVFIYPLRHFVTPPISGNRVMREEGGGQEII